MKLDPDQSRALHHLATWIHQLEDLGWLTIPDGSILPEQLRYLYQGVRDVRYHTAMEGAVEALHYIAIAPVPVTPEVAQRLAEVMDAGFRVLRASTGSEPPNNSEH